MREAVANTTSVAARSASMVLILALLIGAVAFLELRTAHTLVGFAADVRQGGGYLAVAAPADGPVSAAACEAVREHSGVVASGALLRTELTSFTAAPTVLVPRATVTVGLLDVWAPGWGMPAPDGRPFFVVGEVLASELGLAAGSYVRPNAEDTALVAAVIDPRRRNPQSGRWAFEVAPAIGDADQCWVEFEPASFSAGLGALPALLSGGAEPPFVRPFRRPDEFARDPAAEFHARPQRMGWIVVAFLSAGVIWIMTWFRRSELSLYVALGTDRGAIAVLLAMESGILLSGAVLLGTTYAFAVDAALHHEAGWSASVLALRASVSTGLLAGALAPAAALLIVRGSIANLLKER
ncbi:MAG: hypothetical protein Kow0010_27090 [Dehalococcoidia bacterium]